MLKKYQHRSSIFWIYIRKLSYAIHKIIVYHEKRNHLFARRLFFSIFGLAAATRLSQMVGGIMRRVCPIAANPSGGCVTSVNH
jgi:hypothetical protein